MDILLHTIALEPARWTAQRVSRPLAELLPAIAKAGFRHLEIYEPHLALAPDETILVSQLASHRLVPVVLSSYLDLSPAAASDDQVAARAQSLIERVERFGFRKVRLFPGCSPSPSQTAQTVHDIARRLRNLTDRCPTVEFLLETHDGSLADDPACVISVMQTCGRPNIGLLWQPTVFEPSAARAQFAMQRPFIRHCHLQNRHPDGSFATLGADVVPWGELLDALPGGVDVTLEFVPSGICPPERFSLDASLDEAVNELRYVREHAPRPA